MVLGELFLQCFLFSIIIPEKASDVYIQIAMKNIRFRFMCAYYVQQYTLEDGREIRVLEFLSVNTFHQLILLSLMVKKKIVLRIKFWKLFF